MVGLTCSWRLLRKKLSEENLITLTSMRNQRPPAASRRIKPPETGVGNDRLPFVYLPFQLFHTHTHCSNFNVNFTMNFKIKPYPALSLHLSAGAKSCSKTKFQGIHPPSSKGILSVLIRNPQAYGETTLH